MREFFFKEKVKILFKYGYRKICLFLKDEILITEKTVLIAPVFPSLSRMLFCLYLITDGNILNSRENLKLFLIFGKIYTFH